MFLRSLSMRGFKSFADRTTLEVEPGITVIVGPNGSGKSNVVDALAWVLGTHSAKKVRGGSMSDVIFAGSPTRTRANQARVEIAIDNTDGRLAGSGLGTAASAAGFAEVRVARTIHADGESSYELNGEQVRALDVQELLSDTGLGRELHTVVGQGQLDEILNAKPEERRRYIEEAAGILKHRRRRERALRKLDQVEEHIDKLRTVLRELRRQLRPLERQAEAADRHAQLQAELREVKVSAAAAELARLDELASSGGRDDAEAAAAQHEVERRLEAHRDREATLEAELAELGPAGERARGTHHQLASLGERLRGTSDLVEAKRRHLVEYVEEPLAGRPPAELRASADRVEADAAARARERDDERATLDDAAAERRDAEQARRAHEQVVEAERRRRAETRERVLRWEGEVSALRGSVATTESELARVTASLASLDERIGQAEGESDAVQDEIRELDRAEVELTSALETAEAAVAEREARVEELATRGRELEGRHSSLRARAEALRTALAETDGGAPALLEADLDGLLGPVADHVRIAGEAHAALAAALGPLGEAVAVTTVDRARGAVAWLREAERGPAVVLPARGAPTPPEVDADLRAELDTDLRAELDTDLRAELDTDLRAELDTDLRAELDTDLRAELDAAGATPVPTLLAPASDDPVAADVVAALRGVLATAVVVEAWDDAVLLHGRHPHLTVVTPAGDVAGPRGYHGGASPQRSAVSTATAADSAERDAMAVADELAELGEDRRRADATLTEAKRSLVEATERINASDARITGAAEQLARLNKELHSLTDQRGVVAGQRTELAEVLERDRAALTDLEAHVPGGLGSGGTSARSSSADRPDDELDDEDGTQRELDEAVEAARERELDGRVRLERAGEQVRHLEQQAASLRTEADEVEAALAEAARRRERRREGITRCGELALVTRAALDGVADAVQVAVADRDRLQDELGQRQRERVAVREQVEEVIRELDACKERRHAVELRRAELDSRRDALTERLRAELSLSPDEVRAEHPEAGGYDLEDLGEREDVLVRRIGLLGRVNPLALEEFQALEERHAFLSDQLDDLRRSKGDLAEVVVAVDERIRTVFAEAFDDVAREFELTFATVFPEGHGRLVLTEPDDLLSTGIEVEARPPGKKVTRLSLLSGGERSLTVLAFVFAIFRARPSPFYVLDEVDAALDDVNLQRLLKVVRSFRGHAQVILVTHQKRSMEIADVLYGVTMGSDAVSQAVAERLRERADAPAQLETRASDAPTEAVIEA